MIPIALDGLTREQLHKLAAYRADQAEATYQEWLDLTADARRIWDALDKLPGAAPPCSSAPEENHGPQVSL